EGIDERDKRRGQRGIHAPSSCQTVLAGPRYGDEVDRKRLERRRCITNCVPTAGSWTPQQDAVSSGGVDRSSSTVQLTRRRIHQKQNPTRSTAMPRKIPASAHCRDQKWLSG